MSIVYTLSSLSKVRLNMLIKFSFLILSLGLCFFSNADGDTPAIPDKCFEDAHKDSDICKALTDKLRSSKADKCTDARTDARKDFLEACKAANLPQSITACAQQGRKCADVVQDTGSDDDFLTQLSSGESDIEDVRERVSSCRPLASAQIETFKGDMDSAQERRDDLRDRINDDQSSALELQTELLNQQTEAESALAALQQQLQQVNLDLATAQSAAKAQERETIASLRAAIIDIEEQMNAVRRELRAAKQAARARMRPSPPAESIPMEFRPAATK